MDEAAAPPPAALIPSFKKLDEGREAESAVPGTPQTRGAKQLGKCLSPSMYQTHCPAIAPVCPEPTPVLPGGPPPPTLLLLLPPFPLLPQLQGIRAPPFLPCWFLPPKDEDKARKKYWQSGKGEGPRDCKYRAVWAQELGYLLLGALSPSPAAGLNSGGRCS